MSLKNRNITYHVLPVARSAYPYLRQAVAQRQLQPSDEQLRVMQKGQVYRPVSALLSAQTLVHDRQLQLGDLTISGDFYRLPEQEYCSIITASNGYSQYPDIKPLMTALLAPMTQAEEAAWLAGVRAAAAQGRQPSTAVDLIDDIWVPTTWLRDRTRLVLRGKEWFVVLYGQAPSGSTPAGHGVIGVDIGLRPLATAAWGQRHETTWDIAQPTVPAGESAEVQALARILNYTAARAALEALMVPVLAEAGTLVLEQLDYGGFRNNFPNAARRHAVADWHQSWLPQRAHARGIRVVRVPAAFTSQLCSQCPGATRGTRRGRVFTCPRGHALDAHLNAARNLVRRYRGELLRAQQLRARAAAGVP
ncbi:hypothetical protein GCM10010840_33950 [Deinococcus aerolatus]|uniref:Cas12f1-like TNB domain-containing protein n=1 Tax=Deinococcus aerolatus TaxID=522487 RepID=A0ABQ2GEX8_9DEIO|nr:zinc ribbon domain-containing protein [Deinococcus aerolatus]GGL93131.1 hypothetical protein GCM10010840_33950 [Deinococcus aerolatus]